MSRWVQVLLAITVLSVILLFQFGSSGRSTSTVALPWSTYLLNQPPALVSWNRIEGSQSLTPFDLREGSSAPGTKGLFLADVDRVVCGTETRRALVQRSGSEVVFGKALAGPARLRFGIGFTSVQAESSLVFELEVLSRTKSGDETLWSASLSPPEDADEWGWTDVDLEVEGSAEMALVFRMRSNFKAGDELSSFPVWSNPVLFDPVREAEPSTSGNQNVVLFLVDTLRADHVGHHGFGRNTTPVLDAIAREGLQFSAAHAVSSWTKPSVASLLTSRYPVQHGAEDYGHRLNDSELTLGQILADSGYRTAAIGENGWIFMPVFNFSRGFQDFIHVVHRPRGVVTRSDSVVDEAIGWLNQHYREPFFLYIQTVDPHAPYEPPESSRASFVNEHYRGTLDGSISGPAGYTGRRRADVSQEELDHIRSLYDAEIAFNDEQLGRLVARMKALQVWEETTFVVTSDHGEEFLEHGSWSHGTSLYQEQLHVPLVIKPRRSASLTPEIIDVPVSLLGVAPTVCELLGLSRGLDTFAGRSLLASTSGSSDGDSGVVISELNKQSRHLLSVRSGPWKYITSRAAGAKEELFHLVDDPGERVDLFESADPSLVESLRSAALEHLSLRGMEGLELTVYGATEPVDIELSLSSTGPMWNFNLLEGERGQDFLKTPTTSDAETHRLVARLRLDADDDVDGVLLQADESAVLSLSILIDGVPLNTERVLLGPAARPADGTPVRLSVTDQALHTEDPIEPASKTDGVWCRVLYHTRPAEHLEGAELEEMKSFGYFGDD